MIPTLKLNGSEIQFLYPQVSLRQKLSSEIDQITFGSLLSGSRFRTVHDFGYVALDIMYLTGEDAGVYMCKATNQLGEAITSATLKIKSKFENDL